MRQYLADDGELSPGPVLAWPAPDPAPVSAARPWASPEALIWPAPAPAPAPAFVAYEAWAPSWDAEAITGPARIGTTEADTGNAAAWSGSFVQAHPFSAGSDSYWQNAGGEASEANSGAPGDFWAIKSIEYGNDPLLGFLAALGVAAVAAVGALGTLGTVGSVLGSVEAAPALLADAGIAAEAGTGFVLADAAPIALPSVAVQEAAIVAQVSAWQAPAMLDVLPTFFQALADALAPVFNLAPAEAITLPSLAVQEATIAAQVSAWQAPALADLLPAFTAPAADAAIVRAAYTLPTPEPIALPSVAVQEAAIAAQVSAWQAPALAALLPTITAPALPAAPTLAQQVAGKVGTQAANIATNKAAGSLLAGLGLGGQAAAPRPTLRPTLRPTMPNTLRPASAPANPTTNAGGLFALLTAAALLLH